MINASQVKVTPLSSLLIKDITLQSNYNTFDIQHQSVKLNNNVTLKIPRVFLNAKDVSINNSSLLVLADYHKVNSVFKESKKKIDVTKLINNTTVRIYKDVPEESAYSLKIVNGVKQQIKTVIQPATQFTYLLSVDKNNIFSLYNKSFVTLAEVFIFKITGNLVSVCTQNNSYLTDRGTFIQFLPKSSTFKQTFEYILNDNSIILFKEGSNFQQAVDFSLNSGLVSFTPNINSIANIPQGCMLYLDQLKDLPYKFNSIEDSFIAKYTSSPLSASNSLELDDRTKRLNYDQNYLINIPLETYFNDSSKHIAYINSLKNYQTANYNYSLINDITTKREYTNIFTGTNQELGYSNIYLNYHTNTLEKVLLKNTETTFHYPATVSTNGIYLSAAGLIEEGAISGRNPFTADRVMLSRRDYRELNVPLLSASIADNTWLYAWLSAGDNGSSCWMDRFYTGARFDLTQQEYLAYTVNSPLVIDQPSTMKLLPNRVYKYFHQGQQNIKTYIDNLSYIDRDQSTKILEITKWDTNILEDTSVHKNDGIISLNENELIKDYFYLDGKSYALFPATSSLSEDKQLYIGFWLKVDDWSQIEGSQVFGNYADGGYGLFNKQSIPTSFITLYDNNNHYIYNINSNFKLVNEQSLLPYSSPKKTLPVYIVRTADQNYWLIDSNTMSAGKYDLNNNLLIEIQNLAPLKYISQVEIDDIERIYVVDNITQKICLFDSYTGGRYSDLQGIDFKYKRLELIPNYEGNLQVASLQTATGVTIGNKSDRLNDRVSQVIPIGINGDYSVSDNLSNVWYSVGINLYKNSSLYANIGQIEYLTCDSDNNIWVLHDRYKITKINTADGTITFSKTFMSTKIDVANTKQKRFINFVSIKQDGKEVDYAIVVDSEEKVCYFISKTGSLYNKINLLIIPSVFLSKHNFNRSSINFTCYGDFTGYQYQRKFNNSYELVWKVKATSSATYTASTDDPATPIYLPFNTSGLDAGWHYLSLSFDHSAGSVAAYVDAIKVNEYKFVPFTLRIKQSFKPLSVGAVTTDQGILNDTIGINDKHKIVANFAHLHMYKYSFKQEDINLLFKCTHIDLYKDIVWNIPIGKRNYIEQIERFFMCKMPGSKSKFFNLRIKNFPATKKQKDLIEEAIKTSLNKLIPADTTLHKIKWD